MTADDSCHELFRGKFSISSSKQTCQLGYVDIRNKLKTAKYFDES